MIAGHTRTYSGKLISLLNPRIEQISLIDIIHHLSLECRWGGAIKRFFSVAQHSIWVRDICVYLSSSEDTKDLEIHALLHDSAEAYLKDIPRPMKVLFPQYKQMADKMTVRIYEALGLEHLLPMSQENEDLISKADEISWQLESYWYTNGPHMCEMPKSFPYHLQYQSPWTPDEACINLRNKFQNLGIVSPSHLP